MVCSLNWTLIIPKFSLTHSRSSFPFCITWKGNIRLKWVKNTGIPKKQNFDPNFSNTTLQSLGTSYEGLEKLELDFVAIFTLEINKLISIYRTLIAPCSKNPEGWNCDFMHERAVSELIASGSNHLAVWDIWPKINQEYNTIKVKDLAQSWIS